MHKNDPGAYTVELFQAEGRKRRSRREWVTTTLIDAQRLANCWKRRTGGSAVVKRCIDNTELRPERWGMK
jgi:hypothetical protein